MTHPAPQDLFAYVHGWDPRPDHLDGCRPCLKAVGSLREELDLLRRAEARVRPAAGPRRVGLFVPLGVAAAALLAVVGFITLRAPAGDGARPAQEAKAPTARELGETFLNGADDEADRARRALLELGPAALFDLTDLRRRRPEAKRAEGLASLILELKRAAAGDEGRRAFELFADARIALDIQNAPMSAALDYVQEVTHLPLVVDPLLEKPPVVSLKVNDVRLGTLLDLVCNHAGLDYDYRYGTIFFAAPDRLWAAPKEERVTPLTDDESKKARALVARFGSESFEEREAAAAELRRFGATALPALEEGAKGKDPEVVARCRGLIAELRRKPFATPFPRAAAWRSQKIEEASREPARKLDTMKIDLAFENSPLSDVVAFIRDFSGLNIVMDADAAGQHVTVKVKDFTAGRVLELIFLPRGMDVRLEQGVVTIFKPKK